MNSFYKIFKVYLTSPDLMKIMILFTVLFFIIYYFLLGKYYSRKNPLKRVLWATCVSDLIIIGIVAAKVYYL